MLEHKENLELLGYPPFWRSNMAVMEPTVLQGTDERVFKQIQAREHQL
jgi:hypothetical protein